MEIVSRISKKKLTIVIFPPAFFCIFIAISILIGIINLSNPLSSRSFLAGIFSASICAIVGLFYLYAIIRPIMNNSAGIYTSNERLIFYNLVYNSVGISEIEHVEVDRSFIIPRIIIKTKNNNKTVMSNVMKEDAVEIVSKIESIIDR